MLKLKIELCNYIYVYLNRSERTDTTMNKKLARINKIVDLLKENHTSSTKELAAYFNVSEMTIRRDLEVLSANNIIDMSYGAIYYNEETPTKTSEQNYEVTNETGRLNDEKNRIGQFAASLIEPNDIIIIDTGSTTDQLARHIPDNVPMTVLCYNLNILSYIQKSSNIQLIFAGGYYHSNTQMFESVEGVQLIRRTRANKVFVSAAGIHERLGITCVHHYEVATKNAIIDSSVTKILLADSSKFGIIRPAYFSQLNDFDIIITDNQLSKVWVDYIHNLGIQLYLV